MAKSLPYHLTHTPNFASHVKTDLILTSSIFADSIAGRCSSVMISPLSKIFFLVDGSTKSSAHVLPRIF